MKCDELKRKYSDITGPYYGYNEVNAAIEELKEELYNKEWRGDEWARNANDKDKQIAELKADNRKLKRALWLARANDASSFAGLFSTLSYIDDDETRTYWIFGNKRKIVIDGLKCSRMEIAYKWFCIWDDVANKCLKKAGFYL